MHENTRHIPEETLRRLRRGELSGGELDGALSHLSHCPDCAAALAEGYGETELLPLPPDFVKDTVTRRNSRAGQRDGYGLRVFAAVAAALMLLLVRVDEPLRLTPPDLSFAQTASEQLRDFSDRILNLEALRHDQKTQ